MHDVPYVGHYGYQNTIATTKKGYYQPQMKKRNFQITQLDAQNAKK